MSNMVLDSRVSQMNEKCERLIESMNIHDALVLGQDENGNDVTLICTTHSSIKGKTFNLVYKNSFGHKLEYDVFHGTILESAYAVVMGY